MIGHRCLAGYHPVPVLTEIVPGSTYLSLTMSLFPSDRSLLEGYLRVSPNTPPGTRIRAISHFPISAYSNSNTMFRKILDEFFRNVNLLSYFLVLGTKCSLIKLLGKYRLNKVCTSVYCIYVTLNGSIYYLSIFMFALFVMLSPLSRLDWERSLDCCLSNPYNFTNMIWHNFPAMFFQNTYFVIFLRRCCNFTYFDSLYYIMGYVYVCRMKVEFRFPDVVADSIRKDAELSFGAESANDYVALCFNQYISSLNIASYT